MLGQPNIYKEKIINDSYSTRCTIQVVHRSKNKRLKNNLPSKIGVYCHTLGVGKDNKKQNALTIKETTTLKLRNYVHPKTPLRKWKRQTISWKKLFVKRWSHKGHM